MIGCVYVLILFMRLSWFSGIVLFFCGRLILRFYSPACFIVATKWLWGSRVLVISLYISWSIIYLDYRSTTIFIISIIIVIFLLFITIWRHPNDIPFISLQIQVRWMSESISPLYETIYHPCRWLVVVPSLHLYPWLFQVIVWLRGLDL